MHLEEDITATNEFTIEVYLWDGRPVGVVFYSLSEVGVLQDVVGAVVLHAVQPQDLHDGVAEAAEGLRRTALHKHHHRVLPHQSFHRFPRPRAAAIGPTTASSAAGGRLAQVSPPGSAPRRPDTQAQGRTQRPTHPAPATHPGPLPAPTPHRRSRPAQGLKSENGRH